MTTKEAIEVLTYESSARKATEVDDALSLAITALRAQSEKERRYVVVEQAAFGPFVVSDTVRDGHIPTAQRIKTREAAQAIADIYEGMEP